ncbi:hypothetical protein BDQ12DRAFT_610208 [Crucibulum laeve]|uniref:HNH nuclease domain-containing protein n=1 Tax=Crucibulum laeve TaxID=68775 RepID=A0A5C3LTJ7_9AGAR|nr:hypothetical protein BDQ12DRAFT_610208 [Crucibulum laeve]
MRQSLANVRLLGYIMLEWPSQEAVLAIVGTVDACAEDELELEGQAYLDHLLRVFRSNKDPTPNPSGHISQPSFVRKRDVMMYVMEEASQNHQTAKKKALIRDGFCCVITGQYDTHTVETVKELRDDVLAFELRIGVTHCSHIFGESVNANISRPIVDEKKKTYAATVWTIMESFGYTELQQELNGVNIYRLENVMTLSADAHDRFDRLKLWFVETDTPNTYRLDATDEIFLTSYPKTVTFENHSDLDLPLPSCTYLKIHAACARIVHLSGAAEYIDMILREMEDVKVLSEDGTSADVSNYAILSSNPRVSVF